MLLLVLLDAVFFLEEAKILLVELHSLLLRSPCTLLTHRMMSMKDFYAINSQSFFLAQIFTLRAVSQFSPWTFFSSLLVMGAGEDKKGKKFNRFSFSMPSRNSLIREEKYFIAFKMNWDFGVGSLSETKFCHILLSSHDFIYFCSILIRYSIVFLLHFNSYIKIKVKVTLQCPVMSQSNVRFLPMYFLLLCRSEEVVTENFFTPNENCKIYIFDVGSFSCIQSMRLKNQFIKSQ